jgi:uncharacterized membrane protein
LGVLWVVRVFDGVLVAVGLEAVGEWRVSLVVYVGMGVGLGLLEGEGGGDRFWGRRGSLRIACLVLSTGYQAGCDVTRFTHLVTSHWNVNRRRERLSI